MKKKEKINSIIKEQKKLKSIKLGENNSEDEFIVKKFIITAGIIIILIGIIYGVTELLIKDTKEDKVVMEGTINYDKISVGTILNRPYEEYFVMVYDSEDKNAVIYSAIISKYMQNNNDKDYKKIYYCDLGNKLNSEFYNINNDNISNKEAKSVEEFDFGSLTLLKINNGKISNYIEDIEKIKEILK